MITKLGLFDLIDIADLHYSGAGHYVVIQEKEYEFIKGNAAASPFSFYHDKYKPDVVASACYLITDIESGNTYVGSSGNLYRRLSVHRSSIKARHHLNKRFTELLKDRNSIDFDFTIIFTDTRNEAFTLEQFFIDLYNERGLLINSALSVSGFGKVYVPVENPYQWQKNRIVSDETRSLLSHIRKTNPASIAQFDKLHESKKQSICIHGVEYDGVMDAVKKSGMTYKAIQNALETDKENVYWTSTVKSSNAGIKRSDEFKMKISLSRQSVAAKEQLKSIQAKVRKRIILNGVEYESIKQAWDATGINECIIHRELKKTKQEGDVYVLDYQKPTAKPVEIDGIVYNSVSDAALALCIPRDRVKGWLRYGRAKYTEI